MTPTRTPSLSGERVQPNCQARDVQGTITSHASLLLIVGSVALTAIPVPIPVKRFAPDRARSPGPNFLSRAGVSAEGVYVTAPDFAASGPVPPFNFPNPDYANVVLPAYESRFGTPTF